MPAAADQQRDEHQPAGGDPGGHAARARLAALSPRIPRPDIALDLAEDIGSARWFRGFGAMLGLSLAALSFWPDFATVEAAAAIPADRAVRDEFRSQMIMPLAFGGDSGRRMGATAAVVPLASAPERSSLRFVATLGQGDSFARLLQQAGVSAPDAARAAELVAGAVPLGEIGAGTRFDVTLGRRGADGGADGQRRSPARPLERMEFRARFDLALAVERRGGALVLSRRPIAVYDTPLRIRGTVGSSLYRSARAVGAPVEAIQQYLSVLDSHISLESDVEPGDRFDLVVSFRRSADGQAQVGKLLYAGLEHEGRARVQLLRWGGDGQFFEASGMGTGGTGAGRQASGMIAPVNGRMTSPFGPRRHPILGYVRMHAGIDFGAAWGSPIFAVNDGIVSYAGRHGGHGNYVRLEHGGGIGTGYGHMSRIAVSPGMRVRAGQVIGFVGSSGLSTGPHLHYELYRGGIPVNPLSVSFAAKAGVDKQELAAFKARLAQIKGIVPGAALQKPRLARLGKMPAPARPGGKID